MGITIFGEPTISFEIFQEVLQRVGSPVLAEVYPDYREPGAAFWAACINRGINPAVALAFFYVESVMGTGPGVVKENGTKSWGNLVADRSLGLYARYKSRYTWDADGPNPVTHYFRAYGSWLDGLRDWAALWKKPIYAKYRGLPNELKRQIVEVYDPGNEAYYERVVGMVRVWAYRSNLEYRL